MIISSAMDYRAAAKRRLPPFLFHCIDGGVYDEATMRRNGEDLRALALRQRVLGEVDLSTGLFGEKPGLPLPLGPGVAHLLDLIASEMRVAMTLTGAKFVADISRDSLADR